MEKNKIDINTIIGFLLIGGILLYFGYLNPVGQDSEPAQSGQTQQDTVEETVTGSSPEREDAEVSSSVAPAEEHKVETSDSVLQKGPYAQALDASGPKTFVLENKKLYLEIASKGGQIVEARLKDYQTYDSLPLHLIKSNSNFSFELEGAKGYNTADLYFKQVEQSKKSLTLALTIGESQLYYDYKLADSTYMLDMNVRSENFEPYLPDQPVLNFNLRALRHEKNLDMELQNTKLEYRLTGEDDDVDEYDAQDGDVETEQNVGWLAAKQQFFSTIIWNKGAGYSELKISGQPVEASEQFTKQLNARFTVDKGAGPFNLPMGIYLGPNSHKKLSAYGQDFDQLIPLGWGILGWINRGIVINVFNWLEDSGLNYGVIILIIALSIKVLFFPLTFTSYKSMAKMRVLRPEIEEINEKYKDKDPMKKQQATMELYQKAGVNPLGGCIPMLLQLPVLIALFRFFPASIELRQESFLWADDLSTYDSIAQLPFEIPFYGDHISLFTLLMTLSTLIYTYMNQQLTGQNQQYPQMKYVIYFMPIMLLGFFNNYAAGLSYYYFVSNVITFSQQFAIRAFIDDDKIHAKIQENKKKPGKENRLMRRMREVQDEQNRQTRRRNKK